MLASALIAAAALSAPAPAAPMAAAVSDADRLVALLASDASLVRLGQRLFERRIQDDANLPEDLRTQFAAHPGMKAHVAARLQREVPPLLVRELPGLRTRLAALVGTAMNPQEIAETIAFLRTPTGAKVRERIYTGIAESNVRSEQEVQQAAFDSLVRGLGPEDYPALLTFAGTPAARKLQTLQPRVTAASRAWGAEMVERHQARVLAMVEAGQRDFLSDKKD